MSSLRTLLKYCVSIVLICVFLSIGTFLQRSFELSIPSSVLGMIVLFLALALHIIPHHWIQPGASLFIRYMVFLFVPISVGIMNHYQMLMDNAMLIVLSAIGGTTIVLFVMSWCLDRWLKRKEDI